jgi:hypothetical protein
MDPLLIWLESTALSRWIVESTSMFAFPGILTAHAIGMGFAAGISVAIDLRILGVAGGVPLSAFRRFLPVLWAGFWVNAVSGVLLLVAYPTKALTNPVFYVKLGLILAAMIILVRLVRTFVDEPAAAGVLVAAGARSRLAALSILCWAGAIFAGRFLAYTYTRLTALQ